MQKILLVQDMLTNMLLTPMLTESGFEVIEVSSFKDAKEQISSIQENSPFTVILDLGLEDTNDISVVEYMTSKAIPTIIYSEVYDNINMDELIISPIIDYVIKKNSEDIKYITKILKQIQNYTNLNVLIVDEVAIERIELEKFIKPLGFKNIFHSNSGIEALEVIKKEKDISLVITIYDMEKMNGLELVQNIKKIYSDDKLAIVSITSDIETDIYIQYLRLGVNSFLKKPYLKNHLNSVIHNEMESLFTKQKILKQTKDLGVFIRKIKSTNMANNLKHKEEINNLTKLNKILEKEKDKLKKEYDVASMGKELRDAKLSKPNTTRGEYSANEINNSK